MEKTLASTFFSFLFHLAPYPCRALIFNNGSKPVKQKDRDEYTSYLFFKSHGNMDLIFPTRTSIVC